MRKVLTAPSSVLLSNGTMTRTGSHLPTTLGASTFSIGYAGASQSNLTQVGTGLGRSKASLYGSRGQLFGSHGRLVDDAKDVESRLEEDDVYGVQGGITLPLAITAAAVVIGGSTPHGYNTGVLNNPERYIKAFINESYADHYDVYPAPNLHKLLWSLSVAIYLAGGMFGAYVAGFLADRFGRKRAILLIHLTGVLASAMFFVSRHINAFELFAAARFVIGFGSGANFPLVPLYLTEISPLNIRGAMGVLHQLGLTIGIFLSQLIGLSFLLGNEDYWHVLLTLSCVLNLISCAVLVFPYFPDSPRYLLVNKSDKNAAAAALRRFRGVDDVSDDLFEMQNELKAAELEPEWSVTKLIGCKPLRLPLLLVAGLALCQQLSGINVVFYYSSSVFAATGIKPEHSQYAVLAIGLVNVLMTIASTVLVDRLGRRALLLGGILLMLISMIVITIALVFQAKASWLAYVSVICMVAFVIGFAIGLGSIPQFIGGELFRQGPKATAMSIGAVLNWTGNFAVAISFPFIQQGMGPYSFIVFMVFLTLFGLFVWRKLPETRNKSIEEIQAEMGIESKRTPTAEAEVNEPLVDSAPALNGDVHSREAHRRYKKKSERRIDVSNRLAAEHGNIKNNHETIPLEDDTDFDTTVKSGPNDVTETSRVDFV